MAEAEAGAALELRGLPPDVPDELLTLYFENRRRSGGGPVSSWHRLGRGGILTFREPADAARVLAQGAHVLQRAQLSLRPAPPWAPSRLLLQGLPLGLEPGRLEQHVQTLLRAAGCPELPCRVLASPRPDRALVQLSEPLSEADVGALQQQAATLGLEGKAVTLAPVPQASAVRVVGGTAPADLLLLELYLENERRSGGGPLEGLCSLPGNLGTVASFQRWQVAERVLQRDHQLQGLELRFVPHYDALEPEELAVDPGAGGCLAEPWPRATEHAVLEAAGSAGAQEGRGAADSMVVPGPSGNTLGPGPVSLLEQEGTAGLRPGGSLGLEGLASSELVGCPEQVGPTVQVGPMLPEPVEPTVQVGPVVPEPVGPTAQVGPKIPELVGPTTQVGPVIPEPVGPMAQVGLVIPELVGPTVHVGPVIPEPVGPTAQVGPVIPEPVGPMAQVGLVIPELVGPTVHVGPVIPEPVGPTAQVGPGIPEPVIPEPVELPGQGPVELVLSMEPGALRFMQLYHEDLLASLGDVDLFPLEETDVTGFQLCGERGPCQAADEFLRSLLGSISCHVLELTLPGSAHFLLGPEGQRVLQGLEAEFRCVFGTEQLARAALDTEPREVDPTEALWTLPGQDAPCPPDSPGSGQDAVSLEEVRELLATLEGLDREELTPVELEEGPEEEPDAGASLGGLEEEARVPLPGATRLEEEAALQLALHRSLERPGRAAEQEEGAALQRALALSLLEQPPEEAEAEPGGAQLVVHVAFEQDPGELGRALAAALEGQLREEVVGTRGRVLPAGLQAQLERCHGVSVALHGDCAVLRGFGAQPARAARHLAALLTEPQDQSSAWPLAALGPTYPQRRPGGLERLAEGTGEFLEVVRAFHDTLGAAHGRVRVVQVERVSHALLQEQYELHRQRMEQRCARRPVEQVLYHGTTASAVPDICAHGFNRSYCGRNGALYGQGVYFARRASLSVQDRYSPPDAGGLKAVFVARVLTGDYGLGCRGLRAPPLRDSGGSPLRFDSVVDCLRQPSIFVIFHDTQALPTHLVTCQNMPGDPSPAS
ncbi:protein mono-ADP-ribosyltransferase PARP10 [Dasypus novemcinctus]|uniref:protein mono-ADP-ribosyltransferase PARP10 n=1 Tax=Dasypus novemcinctus TaxID=9361 RepID=UPI0003292998|nr:protein mono-ADP-ribosyltransferase PARP10 [Dasypus novemcinctus]XP_058132150.1 protein mono-ADP-ribosyltransferase PARP10 [Dasypus novemcinctus]